MERNSPEQDMSMDAGALYREEVFTDHRVGTLRQMTPVKPDGTVDGDRTVLYVGQAQILTPAGTLPLSFEIHASSLAEAVEKFGDAAQEAVNQAIEELKEMRREAASSIMVPGEQGGFGGMGGGGMPGGGMPGGGKIQF